MKMTEIKTEHLRLAPSCREDLPALEALYRMSGEYFTFDPPPAYEGMLRAKEQLNGASLPPGGKYEDQTHFSVWSGGDIIGYFCIDLYYPDEKSAYLPILFISPSARHNGIGREIMAALKARLLETGFERIRLGVSLRNWAAIAFWLRQGFDKITKISRNGDLDQPGRYALIELECDLARRESDDI